MTEPGGIAHYCLQLAPKPLIDALPHDVVEVKQGPDAGSVLFVRKNRMLLIYQSSSGQADDEWSELHREPTFFSVARKHPNYPWAVYEGNVIVVRNSVGLQVHKWDGGKLTLQFGDLDYNDALGYGASNNTFLVGKFFPSNKYLGILSRIKSEVKFRSLELGVAGQRIKALSQGSKDPNQGPEWLNATTVISLVENFTTDGQLSIALRTGSNLTMFRFDKEYKLQMLATVQDFPLIDRGYDRVLFGKFNSSTPTAQYNDLLHFSTEGLTMYRYNVTLPAYEKVYYSTAFSKFRGWNRRTIGTIGTIDAGVNQMHELLYSGPTGLTLMHATADELGFDLRPLPFELPRNQSVRYAFPKFARKSSGSTSDGKLQVILHSGEQLTAAKLTTSCKPPSEQRRDPGRLTEEKNLNATKPFLDEGIPEIVGHRHNTLWLHDQLDLGSLLQPLNPHTGAVELTLPLIDLSTAFNVPIRKIFQYKNIDYSNELGRGWSFPLDYIAHDRYESAFEQDHVYSLVKDNQQIVLTRVHPNRNETTDRAAVGRDLNKQFVIDGYPDVGILFEGKRNRWLVTIEKRTLTYITLSGFKTQDVCSTWPLCGKHSLNNLSQCTRWYLATDKDSAGWEANYFYELVKNRTDIRLKSIELHDGSQVALEYEQDRIVSVDIGTMRYEQKLRFRYHRSADQLLSITQAGRPLFDFQYDKLHRLSKIVYPNGVEWTPTYTAVAIDPLALKKRVDVHHEGMIFYGPDYLVVVDANLVDGLITLHVRDPVGGVGFGPKTNATETVQALPDVRRFFVHAIADLLVLTIIYDTCKDVAVLQYSESDGWLQREYFDELPLDSTVTAGNRFVLLADTTTLRLLTITPGGQFTSTVLREKLPKNFVVHAFPHGYATFDGKMSIFILHDDGQHWMTVPIKKEMNFFTELDKFVASFAITPELQQSIRRGMLADMLGSFRQAIVLKVPIIYSSGSIVVMVRFYTLSLNTETPGISDYYSVLVPYTNLNKFSYTVSTEDKDNFVLGYRLQNKQYELYVKESSGPHKVAFDKHLAEVSAATGAYSSATKKAKEEVANEYARIYQSIVKAIVFALDLSMFGMLTNQKGVLTCSYQVSYDGKHWTKRPLDEDTIRLRKVDQPLTDRYHLVKANANETFKIYEGTAARGTLVFDTRTSKPDEMQLIMPYYVQAQTRGNPLRVHFLGSEPQEEIVFATNEKLHTASNQMALITSMHVNASSPRTMLFRTVKYFLNPSITVLGRQTLKPPEERLISTSYRYDQRDLQLSADGTMFRRLQIVPGSDKSRFGWYEQTVDLHTGDTTRRAFAADGRPVVDPKLREQEAKRRQSEEQSKSGKASDLDKMILDRGGRMQILDLGPYRLVDEMVSYYGFETYEANHFGKTNRWVFDSKLIESEYNNQYLKLEKHMDTLTGQFVPLEPNQSFVVSCWMRTKQPLQVGDHLDTLTVDVLVDGQEGRKMTSKPVEVKQRIGDWSYVETILDTTHFPPATRLIFMIIVAPSANHPQLDVDHIRFSPIGLQLAANIYDASSGRLRAVMGANGLLKSYLYNPKGKRAALFSEHGEVLEFTMESKVMYRRAVPRAKPSVVEMKPRHSRYDRFGQQNPRWRTTELGWLYEKGMVAFIAPGKGATMERTFDGTWNSLALRFVYSLTTADTVFTLFWQSKPFILPCVSSGNTICPPIPINGEILLFITAVRISIWVDGVLVQEGLLDGVAGKERVFKLHSTKPFGIGEFLEMYDPITKVTYHNLSGQPTQLLVYDDPQTVRVREIQYDDIERPILQTKWTKVHRNQSYAGFFAFQEDFVTNFDNATLLLTGAAADLNPACEGFPYSYTIYDTDPTENKHLQGLPGKEYGVRGKYRREYSSIPSEVVLSNLFPPTDGYTQQRTIHPGGAVRVTVEDAQGNKVARYNKVGNYENRLSTFQYGRKSNKIEQELPPMYHLLAQTPSMVDFFGDAHQAERLQELQKQWEVRYEYDEANRMIRKRSPDGGIYRYLYDRYGILRFSLHKDANGTLDRTIHFMYAAHGKISREALVDLSERDCMDLLDGNKAPESENFIDTVYGERDEDPNMRYRSKFATRHIGSDQMTEFLLYNQRDQVVKKTFVVSTMNTSYSIDYEYENDKLRSIKYPIGGADGQPYRFVYDYNGRGEVAAIRETSREEPLFEYMYNADGMMETTRIRTSPEYSFQRTFSYNEPGFLVKLADEYLTEEVSYLETDSYGQDTYTPIYEGLISRTVFTAHWQQSASALRTGLFPEDFISSGMKRKQAVICFDVLKEKRYLTETNQVNRTFYGEREDDLPFVCGETIPANHLSAVLTGGSIPQHYGHRYDYDDHDQLIKAKYFHGREELQLTPLTERSFAEEVEGVNEIETSMIWDILRTEGFLSLDCTNPSLCHGRPGTQSIFKRFIHNHRYHKHLQTMFSKAIADQKGLNANDFDTRCKQWVVGSYLAKTVCRDLRKSLSNRKFIGDDPNSPLAALSGAFKDALKSFTSRIPDIVRVLSHHFDTALGRSAGDVQSYEIDANGNHRKFYTGFMRYRLEYREGTNQITKVHRLHFDRDQRDEQHFDMEHNSDGAVVKAEHKGIKHMEYDRILHRVTKIDMTDGRSLQFQYDVRAERTFKQVLNADGTVSSEKYYIRDANGMVLVDMEMKYLAKDQPPDVRVTSYIYKDQQLVGFVRNDKLYGVVSDHEGSVRLIVRDGEVVAAYDYLPYGQIFRRYGTDLDGQISYLYTGQEWEPEIGLYNYRARLYDPDIGRFYQMDPKEQYPSPYVYAGNSPVALVDPDGEFAFALACLIMAIVGAYIGAASVSKTWNPLKWNWKSTSLWLGLIGGALSGLSIPFNLVSSVSYFVGLGLSLSTSMAIMVGSGITFGYFALAAASGTWDPTKFDFTSPGTWNALLGGIATSAFILTNPGTLLTSFRSITTALGRALFVTVKVGLSVTFAYLFAALKMGGEFDPTKWDFTNPGLYLSFLDGFTTGTFVLVFARNVPNSLRNWSKKIDAGLDRLAQTEVYFRANRLMHGSWSARLASTRYFLAANAKGISHLQRGLLPIAFYTFIVTLRMAESYIHGPVPGLSMFLQLIYMLRTTKGFSNRIVKPLLPVKPNAPLALKLIDGTVWEYPPYSSSGAETTRGWLKSFSIHVQKLLHYFNTNAAPKFQGDRFSRDVRMHGVKRHKTEQQSSKKSVTIENCYRLSNEAADGYFVRCYSRHSITTIHPKADAAVLESFDSYSGCLPLTFDGIPSISCDGERSSILSTLPDTTTIFDRVDGWLLLAHVAPAALRTGKRILSNFFRSAQPIEPQESRQQQVNSMVAKLQHLQVVAGALHEEWEMKWVAPMLDDVLEDVSEYLLHGRGSSRLLFERLEALEADIEEERDLHQTKRSAQLMRGLLSSLSQSPISIETVDDPSMLRQNLPSSSLQTSQLDYNHVTTLALK